jgi:hypothetical protein
MLEIYNETVKDLLQKPTSTIERGAASDHGLDIRLSPEGNVFVKGLSKMKVETAEEVLLLAFTFLLS